MASHNRAKIKIALMTYAIDGRRAKGTARVARASVEAILKHQDEFDITFIHYEKSDDSIYSHGVREVILPTMRLWFLNKRSIRQIWYFLTTRDRYDIVHWYQPRLYPFFWLAPSKHIIVTVHGAGDTKKENTFVWARYMHNFVLKWFRRYIDLAIVCSDYSMHDVVRSYGIPKERVRVVNNGIDPQYVPQTKERIAEVREKYHLPEKFFLGVARLIPNKNVIRTLRAFLAFAAKDMDGFHFVNIGAAGPDRPEVDRLLEGNPYASRVHLIKYVEEEDMPAFYGSATALVFPLHHEGFGLPAIEAMACNTPAILSKTALPEITEKDAVLVNVLDEDDIERGIQLLASDPTARAEYSKHGLQKARQFPWAATGEKVVEIYRQLMR